jgi:hypothetical protein
MPRLAPIRLVTCRCPGGRPAHNGGDIQPRWVVGDIGESEWRVPVSAQRRVAVKAHPPRHRTTPTSKSNKPFGYLAVNKIAKKAITVSIQNTSHKKARMMWCGISSDHLTSHSAAGLVEKASHGKWLCSTSACSCPAA